MCVMLLEHHKICKELIIAKNVTRMLINSFDTITLILQSGIANFSKVNKTFKILFQFVNFI